MYGVHDLRAGVLFADFADLCGKTFQLMGVGGVVIHHIADQSQQFVLGSSGMAVLVMVMMSMIMAVAMVVTVMVMLVIVGMLMIVDVFMGMSVGMLMFMLVVMGVAMGMIMICAVRMGMGMSVFVNVGRGMRMMFVLVMHGIASLILHKGGMCDHSVKVTPIVSNENTLRKPGWGM